MSCSPAAAIGWRSSGSAAAPFADRVHFPGAVLHDTLPDLYRAADLFVLPAVHDAKGNVDGLPNVILEAMASGLPVVGSRVSGLPMAIGEGTNGWLMEEGSVADLRRILDEALADRPRLASASGGVARPRARREFSWDSRRGALPRGLRRSRPAPRRHSRRPEAGSARSRSAHSQDDLDRLARAQDGELDRVLRELSSIDSSADGWVTGRPQARRTRSSTSRPESSASPPGVTDSTSRPRMPSGG